MRRVWIVGAKGHVGSALQQLLSKVKYKIYTTDKEDVDVGDRKAVSTFMAMNRPDVVINCAGITNLDVCEKNPDEAYRVNAIGARNLAIEAAAHESLIIQFSTDDVFAGKGSKPLNEFDDVAPCSVYGKSKLAGEQMIQSLSNKYVILRSSWVYGTGHDFLDDVLKAAKEKKTISVSVDEIAVPTSAIELAKVITYFIENDLFGLYHVVCKGSCSRYEYAKEIQDYTGLDMDIQPITGVASNRPAYTVLDNMMLRLDGVEEPKEWKTALHEYLDSIKIEGGYEID